MNTQFKKGVLELCVLALISKKDRYGYELTEEISKKFDVADVYPLLSKLKNNEYVRKYALESASGPNRNYYAITDQGRVRLKSLKQEWAAFAASVSEIIGEGNDHE